MKLSSLVVTTFLIFTAFGEEARIYAGTHFESVFIVDAEASFWNKLLSEASSDLINADMSEWVGEEVGKEGRLMPVAMVLILFSGDPLENYGGFVQEVILFRYNFVAVDGRDSVAFICASRLPYNEKALWEPISHLDRKPGTTDQASAGMVITESGDRAVSMATLHKCIKYFGLMPGGEDSKAGRVLQINFFEQFLKDGLTEKVSRKFLQDSFIKKIH